MVENDGLNLFFFFFLKRTMLKHAEYLILHKNG